MWQDAFETERLIELARELSKKGFKPGTDNMTGKSAELWLKVNGDNLKNVLLSGKYTPMPLTGFRVTKKGGGFRSLTRLTAIDTCIQKSLALELEDYCEDRFSDSSFAYRKNRGAGAALARFCELGSVYRFASKLDPSDCYGNIDRDVLLSRLIEFFDDARLAKLLVKFASAEIYEDGILQERLSGIPQGAPISPMLCNVYFDGLDKLLDSMSVPFIRYADDVVLFGNDQHALREATETVLAYITSELKLVPNRRKSMIGSVFSMTYLGHSFVPGKDGVLTIETGESDISALHAWTGYQLKNPGKAFNILSDGILRQRDLSMMLETDDGSYNIPVMNTDMINVFSSVIFDSGFLAKAAERGIIVNVFSPHGKLAGRYIPSFPIRSPLTTANQLKAYSDSTERLELAKKVILGSSHNTKLNIRYYRKHNDSELIPKAIDRIEGLEQNVRDCEDYESLLMIEAQIRAAYYNLFDVFIINNEYSFDLRSRRPPKNPFNALLSFGNVLLYNYIATTIEKTALDVRIGFLHATNSREESLNLDVAELFKPLIVDRIALTLVNRRQLQRDRHFTREENGGWYLNTEGKRIYLELFNDKLNSRVTVGKASVPYTDIIRDEVNKLVRHFKTGEKYKPFKQIR